MDFESIIHLDKELLLAVNGSCSLFVDGLAMALTKASTWIPLYISLFYLVLKNNESMKRILVIIACAAACVVLAGTVDDTIVKPMVARWRPTHDFEIGTMVDVVDGYRGGRFGFFSAHAANTFSIAVFFSLLVRNTTMTVMMVCWSLANCWTRMYLGVHFPLDIVCGLLWGGTVGCFVYYMYNVVCRKLAEQTAEVRLEGNYTSTQYTSSGYLIADVDVVATVLVFSLLYCIIKAFAVPL